jgi:hypothetical protein
MARKCPTGFVCTDMSTLWMVVIVALLIVGGVWWSTKRVEALEVRSEPAPKVYVVQAPSTQVPSSQMIRPDLYPEPVQRMGFGIPSLATRGPVAGPVQQVGILAAEGGSSSSAAPDRTILPLFGRELDSRRGRWNYYTRTDGSNPVQVPVRVRNRVCDDDTNGCEEVYNDDSIHVPALGRNFKATIYRKSIFG